MSRRLRAELQALACPTCGAPADHYATLNDGADGEALPWLLEYQCWICERTWRRPLAAPNGCDL